MSEQVAQDQIKAFIERIERLEEERKAIAGDIAEVYAEAKGNGFDKKALKAVVRIRAVDHSERMEHEALVELYLSALGMAPSPADEDEDEQPHVRARAPARESASKNEDHPGGENANSVGKADASHASLRSGREAASRLAHNQEIAGSSPAPATSSDVPRHDAVEADGEAVASASPSDTQSEPAEGSPTPTSAAPGDESAVRPAAALVVAYADTGVVVIERCPPEGVVAHPFAACWPVNPIDVTGGVREPIVKQGKFILDGRGRYFAARDAGIEYPVVQYDGTDLLRDIIRWNLASRPKLSEQQRRLIAEKLAKVEPGRADDVMQLFQLHLEAAE